MARKFNPQHVIFPRTKNRIMVAGRQIDVILQLDSPVIRVLDNVLTPEECAAIIAEGKPQLELATVVPDDEPILDTYARNNKTAFFSESPLLREVNKRLHKIVGLPLAFGEGLQAQCYSPGERYLSHNDEDPKPRSRGENNRVATIVVYLNDVAEGGATGFTQLGLEVVPKPGRAVYFEYGADYLNRAFESGEVPPNYPDLDTRCEHYGAEILKGQKWVITKWFNLPSTFNGKRSSLAKRNVTA